MSPLKKKLIVVGDRLLVRPESGEEKTNAGLYLPATALSARTAQGGWVVTVGPGIPLPDLTEGMEEPWENREAAPRYLRVGVYRYHFTTPEERRRSGHWWRAEYLGPFGQVPPRRP